MTTTRATPAAPPAGTVAPFDGHPGRVRAITFTTGIDELASGGDDGTVRLWDVRHGLERRSAVAHPGGVTGVVVVGDGSRLATTGADRCVRLWDRATGEALPLARVERVEALAGTRGDHRLAVASAGSVRVLDLASGEQLGAYAAPNGVRAMTMSADGSTLAWTGTDGTVVVWGVTTGTSTRVAAHPGGVSALALCPAGQWLVTADADRTVRLWDLDTRAELQALGTHRAPVRTVAISDDRRLVVSGDDDGVINAVEPGSGSLSPLGVHPGGVCALAVGPGAGLVASAGGDRTVRLWGPETGEPRPTLAGHRGGVHTLAVSRDGRRIISGGDDRRARVWDLATGTVCGRPIAGHLGALRAVGLRADDVTVIAAADDGVIWSWDPATGRAGSAPTGRPGPGDRPGGPGAVRAAAVTPDGRRVITGGTDGGLTVWDSRTGTRTAGLRGHLGRIEAVVVTPDGRTVVTAGSDRTVRAWDLASGSERRVLATDAAVNALAVLPDGTAVLIGSGDGRILHWPLALTSRSAEHGRTDPGAGRDASPVADHGSAVTALALTPDGAQLLSGGADGAVRLWDRARPVTPAVLRGHDGAVQALAVTPDGQRIVSGGHDGTIRVWDRAGATPVAGTGLDRTLPPAGAPQGLAGDGVTHTDRLGRHGDVDALAALVADRGTEPPLAIAVLGEPGSGTSSFLHQVRDRVDQLAAASRTNPGRSPAAASVRQVWLDAGHLSGEAAWIGLVDHLATGLADAEAPPDPGELAVESAALDHELAAVRHRLERLERGLGAHDRGRLGARATLLSALARSRNRATALALAVVAGAAAALVALGLASGREAALIVLAGAAVAALPGLTARRPAGRASRAGTAGSAWSALAGRRRSARMQPRRTLRGAAARRRLDLHGEVHAGQDRLDRTGAAGRLAALVAETRSGQPAAAGQLRRAHDHLRRLDDDLAGARAEWQQAGTPGPPPLERVVVYVDGLDRCPARTALDLLAALHLLLRLPLFAVVAAADPTWLRRTLGDDNGDGPAADSRSGQLPSPATDFRSGLLPSPATDFRSGLLPSPAAGDLDRLFPILFALRPLGDEAGELIGALVAPGSSPDRGPAGAVRPPAARPVALDLQPDRLQLREPERQLVLRLRPMLRTPRAITRVVNLYRLVRLGVPDDELPGFVGAEGTGPHQAVLVLLALTVASPEAARALFLALAAGNRRSDDHGAGAGAGCCTPDVWGLLRRLAADDATPGRTELARLADLMDSVRLELDVPGDLDRYRRWAGTVARFSLDTCDLVAPRDGHLGADRPVSPVGDAAVR